MTIVGALDVHRQQITFDYVDNDGLVHWGQIRPARRQTLRCWLAEHCPDGDADFALEGCTGRRYRTRWIHTDWDGLAATPMNRGRKHLVVDEGSEVRTVGRLTYDFPSSPVRESKAVLGPGFRARMGRSPDFRRPA